MLINAEIPEIQSVDLLITDTRLRTALEKDQIVQVKRKICDKFLASRFILNTNRKHYDKIIEDLENGYSTLRNKLPKDLQSTYTCLSNQKFDIKNYSSGLELRSSGLTYINSQINAGRDPGSRGGEGRDSSRFCGQRQQKEV